MCRMTHEIGNTVGPNHKTLSNCHYVCICVCVCDGYMRILSVLYVYMCICFCVYCNGVVCSHLRISCLVQLRESTLSLLHIDIEVCTLPASVYSILSQSVTWYPIAYFTWFSCMSPGHLTWCSPPRIPHWAELQQTMLMEVAKRTVRKSPPRGCSSGCRQIAEDGSVTCCPTRTTSNHDNNTLNLYTNTNGK